MTFVQYARARRMGIATKQIREGSAVFEAQMKTGYQSSSGFRDAFSKVMGAAPTIFNNDQKILTTAWIDTKLGPMSEFQKSVWKELQKIPCGQTRSYSEQAESLGRPTATRAVANANGANQLAIIVPCHRIVRNNGDLGGYGGGLERKRWLLDHEKATKSS